MAIKAQTIIWIGFTEFGRLGVSGSWSASSGGCSEAWRSRSSAAAPYHATNATPVARATLGMSARSRLAPPRSGGPGFTASIVTAVFTINSVFLASRPIA